MRVLIDECVPQPLRHHLPGHTAATVTYMRWNGVRNGALLALMKANGFDVLLTVDKGLPHQQNLAAAGVAVVLLRGAGTDINDLLPLMPAVVLALDTIRPGDVIEITA